jgi:16S rRNA (guanine527-N7)-methyltransferase
MMDEILIKALSEGAAAIGVPLGKTELGLFAVYHREILLWNRWINLISERSEQEIVLRHFLDSLSAAPFIDRFDGTLIDLGSGGGFPGIPLRIALTGLHVTLVESSRKKTSFLAHIIRTLGLNHVTLVKERTEVLVDRKEYAGSFDTVISRAAFKLPELIRIASFFLKPDALLIAMKGPSLQEEMDGAKRILTSCGMALHTCREIHLPFNDISRKIVSYRRISP